MRKLMFVVAVVMIAIAVNAQVSAPGTFSSSVPSQSVQYGAPILSPPSVTLGNGLTPTLVTNNQAYVSGGANVMLGAPVVTPGGYVVPATIPLAPAQSQQAQSTAATPLGQSSAGTQTVASAKSFDFVVQSGDAMFPGMANDNRSLAEVAASMRKSGFAPASGKAFTNDDIARMNQKSGTGPRTANPVNPGPGATAGVTGTSVQTASPQGRNPYANPPATANPVPR